MTQPSDLARAVAQEPLGFTETHMNIQLVLYLVISLGWLFLLVSSACDLLGSWLR